ncbi:vicilin-like seed storage protein At2g18540 [Zingiber officinale]|uniref:vicilin-like seed storage protein At2g18540 n=1 Tax=Zingiber officinale TaxID=94328 RepID=UPI001C4BEB74|nr:vicilin-like seed storage protein At2g18540 [Zingiber officinale]
MARKLVAAAVAAFFLLAVSGAAELRGGGVSAPLLVTKESRRAVVSTDAGSITSVDVNDESRGRYHLEFITMEPSSLFLPVLLHADMLFYVHSGNGRVHTSVREDEKERVEHMDVERGDVSVVEKGSVFYVQSRPSLTEESLQIHLLFNHVDEGNSEKASNEAYSIIGDLIRGFAAKILQKGFGVSEETIEAIKRVEKPPLIIPFLHNNEMMETHTWIRRITSDTHDELAKKNKNKKFNFFKAKPDVENCNGWSTVLTHKDLKALESSHIEAFMVNLSKASFFKYSSSKVYLNINKEFRDKSGGMVQVVCPNQAPIDMYQCKEINFRVKEGDVVAVPGHLPMSHMSYNNGSLVFVGFSGIARKNSPQWLVGKNSVLQTIDKEILALALNVPKSIVKDLVRSRSEPMILDCTSCAEKLDDKMEEEA